MPANLVVYQQVGHGLVDFYGTYQALGVLGGSPLVTRDDGSQVVHVGCEAVNAVSLGYASGKLWNPGPPTYVDPPAATKSSLLATVQVAYANFQMWNAIRAEAVARGAPANVVAALTNYTDARWSDLVAVLQVWRQAPS